MAVSIVRTIAFHGGYLSPEDLRRDMGDPDWVDEYLPSDYRKVINSGRLIASRGPIVLVGYSIGGSLIGHLSRVLPNIIGAVLYESALIGIDKVAGSFPVLWIRNRYESTKRREHEFDSTRAAWSVGREMADMRGEGRHVTWRWGWPPFAHAWDTQLNPMIQSWIANLRTKVI